MDQSVLIQAGASATTISIFLVLAWIYKTVNHRRIRSRCCGHDLDASVDIDETTPKIEPKSIVVDSQIGQIQASKT
jgi:hypothetical protein